ncbi:ArsR family transcriptional regulator [Paramaledivibacter caminithermalis]|uniref:Regulatory protein, arsR family n=1 Tax=Paramaledivibacter caminithermalis (strain DSM 15212 / CIP 107654 / DViRD3) TaxID=1121301 RepID=A0A1M6RZY1_PARC5|nr:ArsR family transcriptional regulator [Paramaledivibacter caminithermalis]SHK37950.1 regulatory protein, arsR family [Paramaledivibacter caminithermalis DSM 15212]
MENRDLIIKALDEAGKSLKSGEISEITGIDKKEVSNIIKKLKEEGVIYSPKRCYYDIKK